MSKTKTKKVTAKNLHKAIDADPKVFETEYTVSPRFQDKMNRVFERYGVEWNPEERDDQGDMAGTVSGDKESVVKFVMDTWKISRRKALKDISERK